MTIISTTTTLTKKKYRNKKNKREERRNKKKKEKYRPREIDGFTTTAVVGSVAAAASLAAKRRIYIERSRALALELGTRGLGSPNGDHYFFAGRRGTGGGQGAIEINISRIHNSKCKLVGTLTPVLLLYSTSVSSWN